MSTALRAHRLQVNMACKRSDVLALSLAKMAIWISLGKRWTGGRHSSSATCMSWMFGTPSEDCESLAPRKKSDSSLSLSGGTGELADEVDRESCCRRRAAVSASVSISGSGSASLSLAAMASREAACLMAGVVVTVPQRSTRTVVDGVGWGIRDSEGRRSRPDPGSGCRWDVDCGAGWLLARPGGCQL